jgi:predicted permease
MQPLLTAWNRMKAVLLRRRLERDLDEELAFHLAMREAEFQQDGLAPDAARTAARRRFGNITHFREQTRDMWMFFTLEALRQDVRFAVRTLRKSPGFAFVAVLALAIGIGGNTAIFSMVDAMRARALPYTDPEHLVQLWGTVKRATVERRGNSYMDFLDWRAQSKSFEDMAAFDGQLVTLAGSDESERISVEFVSAPYFSLLGIGTALGRTFSSDEDILSSPAYVTVISDGLWKRKFGGDREIVGRAVMLNAHPYTIVGVTPPGFKGLTDTAELWVPFALDAPRPAMIERGNRWFASVARLKTGVSVAAAQAELDGISRQLERAYPDTNEKRAVQASPLEVELFGALRPALLTLLAAVAFVLLIACANVANLLIARSETRRREMAVRTALGAGRGRLLRQLVTESCVLTALGAGAGLALARATVSALITHSPVTFPSFVTPDLDVRVATFTIAVSLACGMVVGVAPGVQARSIDLNSALKETARSSDGPRTQRLRNGLVVAEVAMAVVLLVGAGLMIRSVRNLAAVQPGFDAAAVLSLHVSIPSASTTGTNAAQESSQAHAQAVVQGRTLLERIRVVPGVTDVALGSDLPLGGDSSAGFYVAEGMPATTMQNLPRGFRHRVSPGFFSALRIPIIAGRTFTEPELDSASTSVIVSERLVKRFWPGQDPIGKRINLVREAKGPWLSIVGVVGEVKYRGLPDNPTADPDIYLPFADRNSQIAIVVRAGVTPESLVAPIRAVIRATDPSIPVFGVATMEDLIRAQTAQSRFTMWLMGVFAAIALVLAVIGIYGVMSYLVTQRTREIGIRLALGATGRNIIGLVVGNGARMIGGGIALGLAAAFGLERLVASLLFGVTAADVASFVAVAVLGSVALVACYIPAARAIRVDPLKALRYE